ncbi:zinc-binding dehydrogenase [Cuniculiplasma sp. SKW3]|uniref:zinc-binding dehydrogenase n=1 Tax=Cuniculiplasma sp. SKW3 TaxID=3400170 RepID=UPI003FD32E5D
MKTTVIKEIGKSMEIEERNIPEPGVNDVIIEQKFTGICYRDILTRDGFFPRLNLPIVPGHEVSGIIREVGDGADYFKKGDRVSSLIYVPCGHCENCISGKENLCQYKKTLGENIDGAYSKFVKIDQRSLVKVPQSVPEELSTIAACVTGMVIHALDTVGGISEGKRVLITGAGGGVGSHSIQIAKAYGAEVMAVTSSEWKKEELYKLGADHVISAGEGFSKKVKEIWPEGSHISLENTGDATFTDSFRSLAFGGKMVVVGNLTPGAPKIPLGILILKGNSVQGSISSTRYDLERALEMSAKGKIKAVVSSTITIDEVNKAFEDIKNKKNLGKVFIKF